MNNSHPLENFSVPVKLKLSALWAATMFCYIYGDYFSFYVPKKLESFLDGNTLLDSPQKLFAASVLMVIPSLMVFLSLVTRPHINRWLNILFGAFYTGLMLLIAFTNMKPWWAFYVFLAIVESILTGMVVWYAWRWPRRQQ